MGPRLEDISTHRITSPFTFFLCHCPRRVAQIGFPELDTTYESTGFTRMTLLMVAALLVGVALAEINKEVSMKNFMYYHWALSAALITWQTGGTATSIGKMMFAMPQRVLLISSYCVLHTRR